MRLSVEETDTPPTEIAQGAVSVDEPPMPIPSLANESDMTLQPFIVVVLLPQNWSALCAVLFRARRQATPDDA